MGPSWELMSLDAVHNHWALLCSTLKKLNHKVLPIWTRCDKPVLLWIQLLLNFFYFNQVTNSFVFFVKLSRHKFTNIEIINKKLRHNEINVKYCQMTFPSARWRCSWEFLGTPWSNETDAQPPEGDNPLNLLFNSQIKSKDIFQTLINLKLV